MKKTMLSLACGLLIGLWLLLTGGKIVVGGESVEVSLWAEGNMPEVSAEAAVVMDALTGRILYAKNDGSRMAMASTTKIMTALLTLEQPGLDTAFTVDPDAIRVEGTSMGLTEGAEVTLRTLAAGMLLASGNDGANAAAVRIGGSIPEFVIMMNRRAAQLGLTDTNFETPSGLDGQNHYTTARDLAYLARAALANPDFAAICCQTSMKLNYGDPPADRWLENHNRLLKEYEGCIGVKTGFTKKAGRCLVSAAERDGVTLICVTLKAPSDWEDHKKLLDAAFAEFLPVPEKPEQIALPVAGGEAEAVIVSAGGPEVCALSGELSRMKLEIRAEPFLYAPVQSGQRVGEALYYLDGELYYTLPLTAQQTVEARPEAKLGLWERLKRWFARRF